MKNEQFDELQIRNRQKISYQTMFLLLVTILINGIVKEYFTSDWANPILEANILVIIPALYFVSMCIWKDAYFTDTGVKSNIVMCILLILGAIMIFLAIPDENRFIYNNKLNFNPTGIFFVAISGQYWIKGLIDRFKDKDDE